MGLNEDLGDRENVGSAALATQRAREAKEKGAPMSYQVPEDLKPMYEMWVGSEDYTGKKVIPLIERIARAETALAAANERIAELDKMCDLLSGALTCKNETVIELATENEQLKSSMG